MFLMMRWYVKRAPSQRDVKRQAGDLGGPDWAALKRLIGIGMPVALALFFEVTLFAVVALLVSPLGIVAVAGHQIALNFSALMFVLPLSLGVGATIRVGYRLGKVRLKAPVSPPTPPSASASPWPSAPRCLPPPSANRSPCCTTTARRWWRWRRS